MAHRSAHHLQDSFPVSSTASPAPEAADGESPLLPEEKVAGVLLAAMVVLMFVQALIRNVPPLGRTVFATWTAHAVEVLPSGLTWLTFIGCAAATRRRALLRIELLPNHLHGETRWRWEILIWALWGAFFAVLFVLGAIATWGQRHQTTSVDWLPAWVVSLSVPVGAALVVWRTAQNLREQRAGAKPGDVSDAHQSNRGEHAH